MYELAPVAITAIVFATIYKVIEVLAHRKERIIHAENGECHCNETDTTGESHNTARSMIMHNYNRLGTGALLLGVGLGLLTGIILCYDIYNIEWSNYNSSIYIITSTSLLFGGIAMTICSLYIQKKLSK